MIFFPSETCESEKIEINYQHINGTNIHRLFTETDSIE